jgi:hypothetical protein
MRLWHDDMAERIGRGQMLRPMVSILFWYTINRIQLAWEKLKNRRLLGKVERLRERADHR